MAEQDENKPELDAEFLSKNLDALNSAASGIQANAMYEAGKKVGQVEGQQILLANMVKMFGAEKVAKVAGEPRPKPAGKK